MTQQTGVSLGPIGRLGRAAARHRKGVAVIWATAYLDEAGYIYLFDRYKDMIISGGENIYPEEVEDTLTRSKLIGGCAVVGLPDERLGAKVVAFVEPLSGDLTPEQLDHVVFYDNRYGQAHRSC